MFLTPTKNTAGINAFRIYIRGKPWVIVTDDKLVTYSSSSGYSGTKFAKPSDDGLMWGPLIEKVGAKIKGAYVNADGGLTSNAMRMLTGAPSTSI